MERDGEGDSEPQPPFRPSVDSLCHPCINTAHLSYRFRFFETSAAALCGTMFYTHMYVYTYVYIYAMCVHRYVYVHTHIIYIYIDICVYIYTYIYIAY